MNFGKLVKDLRIARHLTLRQFCAEAGVDPSNWSKVERSVNPPPGDEPTLKSIARVLGQTGVARQQFFDEAALARSELPADIVSNERVLATLPVFFRAVRGGEFDEGKLQQFVADIRSLQNPGGKSRR